MANQHGDFIWYQLNTPDPEASARFYGAVVGWTARPFADADGYQVLSKGSSDIAGLSRLSGEAGARPGWFGYVAVDDVDEAAAKIVAAGGAQHVPPTDIPGVGRFAMLADPQGVLFFIMRGAVEGISTSFSPTESGHCRWNELATTDQDGAMAFYQAQFGWEAAGAMPMGAMGEYRFITHRGQPLGATMTRVENGPPPAWSFYFGVDAIDAAATAIAANGGTVCHGPSEVPGGLFVVIATDPHGALFGVVGPREA